MTTPVLGLPELILNQSQPHLVVNAVSRELEQFPLLVKSASTLAPPGSPADGDAYIVPPAATGAWSASVDDVAYYSAGWKFIAPRVGWLAYVDDVDSYYQYGAGSPHGWALYVPSSGSPGGSAGGQLAGTYPDPTIGPIRMFLSTFLEGLQIKATQCILSYHVGIEMTLPSSGSKASARAASTGTAIFTMKRNGTSIGTITFTASATGVVAVTGGPLTFAIDDIIDIFGPASPDATLSDIRVTLATKAAGA